MRSFLVLVLAFTQAVALKQSLASEKQQPQERDIAVEMELMGSLTMLGVPYDNAEDAAHKYEMVKAALAGPPVKFHMIPKNGWLCLEGTQKYLEEEVLVRLKASNQQKGWKESTVKEGSCEDAGYWEGPNAEECFPDVTQWMNMEHMRDAPNLKTTLAKEFSPTKAAATPDMECMAPTMYHMYPKNTTWCYEGTQDDLKDALKRLRKSNLIMGWEKSWPAPGACNAKGTHTAGPFEEACWEKLKVWMATHGEQKMAQEAVVVAMAQSQAKYLDMARNVSDAPWDVGTIPNVDCLGQKFPVEQGEAMYGFEPANNPEMIGLVANAISGLAHDQ